VWLKQADVDDGIKDGLTTAEQAEVVRLRRENRRLGMENEILRRAAAYFGRVVGQDLVDAAAPAASCPMTALTVIRMPRMHGSPPICWDSR
jgi:hypothetical protein